MIKNVLPSLRQRVGPQRICSRQKSIHSGTARDSFSQTPHMRGKDFFERFHCFGNRITPAYAGKSTGHRRCPARRWDHPRVCGEKVPPDGVLAPNPGSPPHVRGKEGRVRLFQRLGGITPAYAGKSAQKVLSFWPIRGSPPHVRGKDLIPALCCVVPGITPAYAGKSQGLNIFHTKRSSGPSPAAVPAGPAGSCPASRPSQFPPRMTVISPRP